MMINTHFKLKNEIHDRYLLKHLYLDHCRLIYIILVSLPFRNHSLAHDYCKVVGYFSRSWPGLLWNYMYLGLDRVDDKLLLVFNVTTSIFHFRTEENKKI